MTALSDAPGTTPDGPWATYLDQIEGVRPYLGHLDRWIETLKRPKRCLVVDVPNQRAAGADRIADRRAQVGEPTAAR